jgi:hypothetical protein
MITLFSRCTRRLWSAIVVYRVFAAQTGKQVVGSTEKLLGGVRNGEVRHKWSRHDTAQRNTTHNTTQQQRHQPTSTRNAETVFAGAAEKRGGKAHGGPEF